MTEKQKIIVSVLLIPLLPLVAVIGCACLFIGLMYAIAADMLDDFLKWWGA